MNIYRKYAEYYTSIYLNYYPMAVKKHYDQGDCYNARLLICGLNTEGYFTVIMNGGIKVGMYGAETNNLIHRQAKRKKQVSQLAFFKSQSPSTVTP